MTALDRPSKQRINKETSALSAALDQMDVHPRPSDYTFVSSAHGIFSRIGRKLGHKTSLNKFKKTEIITSIFSDHNALRLEINCKKGSKEPINM